MLWRLGRLDKVLREIDTFEMGVLKFESTSACALFLLFVLCVCCELSSVDGGVEHVSGRETFTFELFGQIDQVWYLEIVPEIFEFCCTQTAERRYQ